MGWRPRDILWIVAASGMMLTAIMSVLDAAYYVMRIYWRLSDLRLYPSLNDLAGGGLRRLFRLPPTLTGSIRRFGIEIAVRGSCYLAGYVKT